MNPSFKKALLYAWKLNCFNSCLKSPVAPNTNNEFEFNNVDSGTEYVVKDDANDLSGIGRFRTYSLRDICI